MLNRTLIKSGDYCINLQVSDLAILRELPKEESSVLRDGIVQGLLAQLKKEQKHNELPLETLDHAPPLVATEADPQLESKELVDLLEGWSPNQQYFKRHDSLEKLFISGIPLILKNHELATHILGNVECHSLIKGIIYPACRISLDLNLTISDLNNFIEVLRSEYFSENPTLPIPQQVYLTRVVFHFLYQDDLKSEYEEVPEILDVIPVSNNVLIWQFFVDAFFRSRCNYLFIGPALEQYIDGRANEYFSHNTRCPLTYLKRIILAPMEIFESYDYETIISDLRKIALLCQNIIEARWVISALFRILPLYKTEDLDIDYDKAKEQVLGGFGTEILSKLHFLKFMELKNSLHMFSMTGASSYLSKYENAFLSDYHSLRLDQLLLLQIEYCSAIYLFLLNNDIESMKGAKFFDYFESEDPYLIDKPLFANFIVMDEELLSTPPVYGNKRNLLKWLYSYIDRMFRMYTERKLTQNPFSLFNYRATSKVPFLRSRIIEIISSFIISIPDEQITNNPSYACKVVNIIEFAKISNLLECRKMMFYVSTALNATKYEVLLNAKSISFVLYYLRYYCDDLSQEEMGEIVGKFKKSSFNQKREPRLYWSVIACIELLEQQKEQDFVISLYDSLGRANRKIYKLALRKDEDFNLSFPDKSVEVLQLYAKNNSLLSLTGIDYLLVAEYWNLLATTVFNLEFPNRLSSLKIASMFYSIAKYFAREQRSFDQKYTFNYIRTQSLYYELSKECPSEFFFRDCSFYVDRPNNQSFHFKEICCEPFFRLISQHYKEIPKYIRELYTNQIIPKRGWVKKAFEKNAIGEFSEEIKIK